MKKLISAAALMLPWLAAGLDFVSIGTNDLAQYTAAADRGSHAVAELADPLGPAVLQLVDMVKPDPARCSHGERLR